MLRTTVLPTAAALLGLTLPVPTSAPPPATAAPDTTPSTVARPATPAGESS